MRKARVTELVGNRPLNSNTVALDGLPLLTPSQKRAAKRGQFKKLGAWISRQGDPNVNDYHSGKPSQFEIKTKPTGDPELNTSIIRGLYRRPGTSGPVLKTQQWERTVRK